MSLVDAVRSQASEPIDFAKWRAAIVKAVVWVLVVLVAGVPFAIAWTITAVIRLWAAAIREGIRSAAAQIGPGGS